MFLHARQARARPNGPSISDLIIPALAHAVFVQCHKRCLSCNRSPFSPAKALIRTWIHKAIAHKRRFKHRFARHFVNLCLCAAPLCAVSFACSLSCAQSAEPLSCQCKHGSDPPTLAPHGVMDKISPTRLWALGCTTTETGTVQSGWFLAGLQRTITMENKN